MALVSPLLRSIISSKMISEISRADGKGFSTLTVLSSQDAGADAEVSIGASLLARSEAFTLSM